MASIYDSEDMELVRSIRYQIGVDQDISAVILQHGFFDHLVGGPGLTADVLNIKNRAASTGRLYFVYTNEPEPMLDWLNTGGHMNKITNTPLRNLYVEKNDEYAVSVVRPAEYGLAQFRREDIRLLNIDCLMKYFETDLAKGITSDGSYIFKPKDMSKDSLAQIVNHHPKMGKFAQIYFKAYSRLGLHIDEESLRQTWRWICAVRHDAVAGNDQVKFAEWVSELSTAPISEML